jgi:hypothetical protein
MYDCKLIYGVNVLMLRTVIQFFLIFFLFFFHFSTGFCLLESLLFISTPTMMFAYFVFAYFVQDFFITNV